MIGNTEIVELQSKINVMPTMFAQQAFCDKINDDQGSQDVGQAEYVRQLENMAIKCSVGSGFLMKLRRNAKRSVETYSSELLNKGS